MRQVSEKRTDVEDTVKSIVSNLNTGINVFAKPNYFNKLQAYLFMNFAVIGLLLVLFVFRAFVEGSYDAAAGFLMITGLDLLICFLIWETVSYKVRSNEKKVVFGSFVFTGVLIFGKILLIMLIIGIPFAMMIGTESSLEYRYVESGSFCGRYVLTRRNWNGQLVDNYGNLYED